MASAGAGGSLPPNFLLTPQQQNLLFAALNSNKQQSPVSGSTGSNGLGLNSPSFQDSPAQQKGVSNSAFQGSPFLDNIDYDYGDSSFDFSFASNADDDGRASDDLTAIPTGKSESTEPETNEKRSHPDDEDDEDSPGKDPKRRESTDKVPKKPGRKPLTSEPSSKRKAQNRAAQRAFRERKEKHLKDLETKVEELEKASEAANHENTLLRSQVERMTVELTQYKQKVSLMTNSSKPAVPRARNFGSPAVNSLGDVNFQFEFPKFGMLPGPPSTTSPSNQNSGSQPTSPPQRSNASTITDSASLQTHFKDEFSKFSGVLSPSMASSVTNASRASLDSGNFSAGNATSSPSASSHSNTGPSSSCGTSPEPFTQSPMGSKPLDTLTTIGEEQGQNENSVSQFANVDINSTNFDWLSQQNGGQFDPQLFGDYREPQDNVLANPSFDDFFNDAIDADFFLPYNVAPSQRYGSAAAPKTNLIDQIDAQQNAVDDEPVKDMNCNQLWEKLQSCPKAQTGEFDLDGLCSELTKKAKCDGHGPVVGETDFDSILQKYMGKDVSSSCVAQTLGMKVQPDKAKSQA